MVCFTNRTQMVNFGCVQKTLIVLARIIVSMPHSSQHSNPRATAANLVAQRHPQCLFANAQTVSGDITKAETPVDVEFEERGLCGFRFWSKEEKQPNQFC